MAYDTLIINGKEYTTKALLETSRRKMMDPGQPGWIHNIFEFITDWLEKDEIEVTTSGTTGTPKTLTFQKQTLVRSAKRTLEFFNLQPGDPVMLCLPSHYIAGKMMIARAIVGKLNLLITEPISNPWENWTEAVKFVPVVPMQLRRLLEYPEKHHLFSTILVGGAPIDHALERKVKRFEPAVFQSFGMTETLTHIAVRRVNGEMPADSYRLLDGFRITADKQNRLVIHGEDLSKPIHTNDVVTIDDEMHFRWHGRYDSVINSGGVKIFPEDIERKVASLIYRRFFIAAFPDEELGQKAVLIMEGAPMEESCVEALLNRISTKVEKHMAPKEIMFFEKFPETEAGKIRRKKVVETLRNK